MMAVAIMYVAGIVVGVAMVEVEGAKGLSVEFVMMETGEEMCFGYE